MQISHNYIYNYFILIKYIYITSPLSLILSGLQLLSTSQLPPSLLWTHDFDLMSGILRPRGYDSDLLPASLWPTPQILKHTSIFFFRIFSTMATLNFFPIQYTWWTESTFNIVSTINPNWCAIPSLSAAPSFSLWLRRANQNEEKKKKKLYLL